MDDSIKNQAAEDFARARSRAILSRIQHFMNVDKDKLLSFHVVKNIIKPKNEIYRGMQVVPIELIVGSEDRYLDFNKYFLPRSDHLRSRWERVDEAHLQNIILPPIQLYEIGGVYFVRDGNHRVSVAKAQGTGAVDAEVTSLSSEIPLFPSMTADELREALIAYEKQHFYEKTDFGKLTGYYDLDFTMPGRYDVIYNHILVHKYYLNQSRTGEIPFSEALVSWYNKVYQPIIRIITEERLYTHFPKRSIGDLYVWIVKRWDLLKKKYGVHYALSDAALDFSNKYGQTERAAPGFLRSLLARLMNRFSRIFKRKR
jgi:hypothetical protein